MARLSAEELATASGNGLTRSVIANLENGRKDDVTVKQLVALASALDVSPAALVFDIHRPGGTPDFTIDVGTSTDYDFLKGEVVVQPAKFRNNEAIRWFGGNNSGYDPDWSEPRKHTTRVFDSLRSYRSTFSAFWSSAVSYRKMQLQKAEGVDWDQDDAEYFDIVEDRVASDARSVLNQVDGLVALGVDVPSTQQEVERVLTILGIKLTSSDGDD
jgi:transcriptional regulator with XRE-family HTH domain